MCALRGRWLLPALLVSISSSALAGTGVSRAIPQAEDTGSAPEHLTVCGDNLYLAADDGVHGKELWRIDAQGVARLVGDFHPGPAGSMPRNLVPLGTELYFVARRLAVAQDTLREYIWKTAETAGSARCFPRAATHSLRVEDITLVPFNREMLAAMNIRGKGRELWRVGHDLFVDTMPGENSGLLRVQEYFATVGDRLLMTLQPESVSSRNLWALDEAAGTASPTMEPLTGLGRDLAFVIYAKQANGQLWFAVGTGEDGMELGVSDGTLSGTRVVKDINPGPPDSTPKDFTAHGDLVYFQANDGEHGVELWCSDGTEAGTRLVKDINPGKRDAHPYNFCSIGTCLLFAATRDAEGTELWRTDGTEAGTRLVRDVYPGVVGSDLYQPTAYNGVMLFAAEHPVYAEELWRSDGTPEGTYLLRDINPGLGDAEPYYLTHFKDRVFFTANDGKHGEEVWSTDGTTEGTRIAADIRPQTRVVRSSNPTELYAAHGGLYFTADDFVNGNELWWTDPQDCKTRLVADLVPGSAGSDVRELTLFQDFLFFTANRENGGRALWRLGMPDEKPERVQLLNAKKSALAAAHIVATDDGLFLADESSDGPRLYHVANADREPIVAASEADFGRATHIANLRLHDETLYLALAQEDGAHRFATLHLPARHLSSLPYVFPAAPARDALVKAHAQAAEMDPDGSIGLQCYLSLPAMRDRYGQYDERWFFAARTPAHGTELWSARTGLGDAQLLADCFAGMASGHPATFVAGTGYLYFVAEQAGKGRELWVSDGTEAGTYVPHDISSGSFTGAGPADLMLHEGAVCFSAAGWPFYETRRMLSKCIEGDNGLLVVSMMDPGRYWPEAPRELTAVGHYIYFSGYHPASGRELWRYWTRPWRGQESNYTATMYERVANIGPEPAYAWPTDINQPSFMGSP